MQTATTDTRTCKLCKRELPMSAFHGSNSRNRVHRCRECVAALATKCNGGLRLQDRETPAGVAYAKLPLTQTYKRQVATKLNNAIKSGLVTKPDQCSRCNKTATGMQLQAHHYDYNKPLDVVWLCIACHKQVHREAPVGAEFDGMLPIHTYESRRNADGTPKFCSNGCNKIVHGKGLCKTCHAKMLRNRTRQEAA
jgi:hypothetical protein